MIRKTKVYSFERMPTVGDILGIHAAIGDPYRDYNIEISGPGEGYIVPGIENCWTVELTKDIDE